VSAAAGPAAGWTREQMAARVAQDIPDGSYVNLGIGIPELVAAFVPEGRELVYHTENGILGMGPPPPPGEEEPEVINAGKQPITTLPAMLWLAREVWPRVRARVPDARLELVGRAGHLEHALPAVP